MKDGVLGAGGWLGIIGRGAAVALYWPGGGPCVSGGRRGGGPEG